MVQCFKRNAFVDRAFQILQDAVKRTADLTSVAGHVGHTALMVIELFERHHRQIDIVFLEAEDTRRIVQQHVGIKHIKFVLAVVLEIFVSSVCQRRFFENLFGFNRRGGFNFLLGFFSGNRFNGCFRAQSLRCYSRFSCRLGFTRRAGCCRCRRLCRQFGRNVGEDRSLSDRGFW